MPWAASRSPISAELVSTIWPRSSSVPTATTSQRIAHTTDTSGGRTAAPSPRASARSTARRCTRRGRRRPTGTGSTATWRRAPSAAQGEADGELLGERLVLGGMRLAGIEMPFVPITLRYTLMTSSRAAMMATGSDPEHVAPDEREHRPEDQHLVGERVEEGARAGRCLAAGRCIRRRSRSPTAGTRRRRRPTTRRRPRGSARTSPATAAGARR